MATAQPRTVSLTNNVVGGGKDFVVWNVVVNPRFNYSGNVRGVRIATAQGQSLLFSFYFLPCFRFFEFVVRIITELSVPFYLRLQTLC